MSDYILTRIETLQQELEMLKQKVLLQEQRDRPKIQLKGIWKGVEISDELLESAKQSLIAKDYRQAD